MRKTGFAAAGLAGKEERPTGTPGLSGMKPFRDAAMMPGD